jgi:hypothetical protein
MGDQEKQNIEVERPNELGSFCTVFKNTMNRQSENILGQRCSVENSIPQQRLPVKPEECKRTFSEVSVV